MANNKKFNLDEQGEELDTSSLDSMPDLKEDGDEYEIIEDNYEEFEDEEEVEAKRTLMDNIANAMNLNGKSKTIIAIALIGIIAVVLIANPFGNKEPKLDENGEPVPTFFSKIFNKSEGTETADGVAPAGEELEDTILRELETDNPGYEIFKNEDGTINLTGELDGQVHSMLYSPEGELLSEVLAGQEMVEGATVHAFTTKDGQIVESDVTPVAPAQPVGEAIIPEYQIPEDTVLMKKTEYDKSINSLNIQTITEEYDENGTPYYETYTDKLIVQYEKLPIKGKIPMLYSKVIETGETIIFPVTLEQYVDIEDKGTTVVGVDVVVMHGVTSYDDIYLVEWKK